MLSAYQSGHTPIYITVFILALLLINLFGVRSVSALLADAILSSLYPLEGLGIVGWIQMGLFRSYSQSTAEIFFASLKSKCHMNGFQNASHHDDFEVMLAVGLVSRRSVFIYILFYSFRRKIIGGLVISLGGGPNHKV